MSNYSHNHYKDNDYHGNNHQHYPSSSGDSSSNFFNRSSDGFLSSLLLLLSINKVAQVTAIVTWTVFVDYLNIRANNLGGVHTDQLDDWYHAADEGENDG